MLIFDQLKKNDPQLQLLTLIVIGGLGMLLAGLWWVQVVSVRDYRENLETQSFRSIRIPAIRGKILDRNGVALAENRPTYNASLYLEELRGEFTAAYDTRVKQALSEAVREQETKLGRRLTSKEESRVRLSSNQKDALAQQARESVASNVIARVSGWLQEPLTFNATNFEHHYEKSLAMPFPISKDLSPSEVARFQERCVETPGLDLEVQSTRSYPFDATAAHLLGELKRDDDPIEGEPAFFSYRLPDFRGVIGIEAGYDKELHGTAGEKSVLVNNLGFRQSENILTPAEPGQNVVLTIDLQIQQAAEKALPVFGPETRGAAVVMDVKTGDILAMASAPAFNPNSFIPKLSAEENARLQDPKLRPQFNRATQENYAPGSIFKPLVGLACLEAGLDPRVTVHNPGFIFVGRRRIGDLAAPGEYDFRRAIMFSCNTYFITNGLRVGIENILNMSHQFCLGERTGLPTRQETGGILPSSEQVHSGWSAGETANICIGQGKIAVTPLQMTVMTAALANGGNVLWPRLVDRIESQDPALGEPATVFPKGRVRNVLHVSPRNLRVIQDAMRDEVEDAGTGSRAVVPGLTICGKTGTAQVMNERNQEVDRTTWFISFAPYEAPRWAVVVMVESGNFGGTTCAPIAQKIYTALLDRERRAQQPPPLARAK